MRHAVSSPGYIWSDDICIQKNAVMHMSEFAKKSVFNKPDAFKRHMKPAKFWNAYVKLIADSNFSVTDMLK